MLRANLPARFNIPFASGAGGGFIRPIPQASQIGIQGGAASLTDGFPPLNFQPVASGGIPPFGADFNGILNQISAWSQWFEAGGPIFWDSTFASGASGGYPQGAIVQSNIVTGSLWWSTTDNNTTNPDAFNQTAWIPLPGLVPTGTPLQSLSPTVPAGYVPANATTIGNAASNATGRANGDTLFLYRMVWVTFSNTACPLLNSAGVPIARGANPDADFAANNQLTTPDLRGRALVGVDTMAGGATTRLSGVPITSGNTTTPGGILGENLHALLLAENGPHAHGVIDPTHGHVFTIGNSVNFGGGSGALTGGGTFPVGANTVNNNATGISLQTSGSGTPHNTVSQSSGVFWNLKL